MMSGEKNMYDFLNDDDIPKNRFFAETVRDPRDLAICVTDPAETHITTPIRIITGAVGKGNITLAVEFAHQQSKRGFQNPFRKNKTQYLNANLEPNKSVEENLRRDLQDFCTYYSLKIEQTILAGPLLALSTEIAKQLEARGEGGRKYIFVVDGVKKIEDAAGLLPLIGSGPNNTYANMLVFATGNPNLGSELKAEHSQNPKAVTSYDIGALQFKMVANDLDEGKLLKTGISPIEICDILLDNARLKKKLLAREQEDAEQYDVYTRETVRSISKEIIEYFLLENNVPKDLFFDTPGDVTIIRASYLKLIKTFRTYIELDNERGKIAKKQGELWGVVAWEQAIDLLHMHIYETAERRDGFIDNAFTQELESLYIAYEAHIGSVENILAWQKEQISTLESSKFWHPEYFYKKNGVQKLDFLRKRRELYKENGEAIKKWYTLFLSYKKTVDELLAFGEAEPAPITDPDAIARALNLIRAIKVEIELAPSKDTTFKYRMEELLTEIAKYHPNPEVKEAVTQKAENTEDKKLQKVTAQSAAKSEEKEIRQPSTAERRQKRRHTTQEAIITVLTDNKLYNTVTDEKSRGPKEVLPMVGITQSLSEKIWTTTYAVNELAIPFSEVEKKSQPSKIAANSSVQQKPETSKTEVASLKHALTLKAYQQDLVEHTMSGWAIAGLVCSVVGIGYLIYKYFAKPELRVYPLVIPEQTVRDTEAWRAADKDDITGKKKISNSSTDGGTEVVRASFEDDPSKVSRSTRTTMDDSSITTVPTTTTVASTTNISTVTDGDITNAPSANTTATVATNPMLVSKQEKSSVVTIRETGINTPSQIELKKERYTQDELKAANIQQRLPRGSCLFLYATREARECAERRAKDVEAARHNKSLARSNQSTAGDTTVVIPAKPYFSRKLVKPS